MDRRKFIAQGQATIERLIAHMTSSGASYKNNFPEKQLVEQKEGSWYKPDLEIFSPEHYGVEVKGMQVSWIRSSDKHPRAGRLKLTKSQWDSLLSWCKNNKATPLLIVELKTLCRRAPYLYFKIPEENVNKLAQKYKGEWVSGSIWEIIDLGEKI